MPPKNSGGSTKFPGGHKVIHRTAQTAFVRVVIPRPVRNWIQLERASAGSSCGQVSFLIKEISTVLKFSDQLQSLTLRTN